MKTCHQLLLLSTFWPIPQFASVVCAQICKREAVLTHITVELANNLVLVSVVHLDFAFATEVEVIRRVSIA